MAKFTAEGEGKRFKFTAARVADKVCPAGKKQEFWWDTEAPGLGLRVTAAGARSYVFQGTVSGKTVRVTIGSPEAVPLETSWTMDKATGQRVEVLRGARQEAARLKALTVSGMNPAEKRREQIKSSERAKAERMQAAAEAEEDARRRAVTVGEAWAAYLDFQRDRMGKAHIERGKKWGARHMLDHERLSAPGGEPKKRGGGKTLPGPLAPVLRWRMVDVTADKLAEWVGAESATRANNARQAFEAFRAFWRWCAGRPEYAAIIDPHAVESKELRADVPGRKSKKFDVFERAHLKAWFEAVRGINNPVIAAYLQGLMLTGARREELGELKWKDVDFKLGAMWLKDKVHVEGRKVPLTPYLAGLIQALPRRNEWVFSSPTSADGKLAEPRLAHVRALEAAGLPHVSLHGLRRTFASLAEWVEMPVGVVAQIMGHAPNATAERHYKSRPLELLAVWHRKYEAWILEQADIHFDAADASERLRVISAA